MLGTAVGIFSTLCGLSVLFAQDGPPTQWLTTGLGLATAGVIIVVTVWTARLSVQGGSLVAKNFYGSKSILLTEIVDAEPVIIGLLFRSEDGTRMRSLASGRAFDELWHTRAERICDEVLRMAKEVRRRRLD